MSASFAAGLVGIVLDDRYRLDALLGEGGMGAVYRAHHLAMDRKVAVKLLKPHLTNDGGATERFIREARATMKVDSDHAVKVLDFGITPQRDYYMVLEFLDGRTVQKELDVDGPFSPARVVHIAKQALHALGAAHASGLVHRDIKPDNILLMRAGDDPDYTKVLDFGVAKLMDGAAKTSRSALAITQAGMVFGTPEYMSPEQACGQSLDGRSDLYSLAATMFAMLTGCGMYNASSAIEWLTHHARTPAPHLSDGEPALAKYKELDDVLQRCLAKQRDRRPRDAREMITLLESVEQTLRGAATSAASSTAKGLAMQAAQSSYVAAVDPNATLVPGAVPPLAGSAAPLAGSSPPLAGSSPPLAGSAPPLAGSSPLLAGSSPPLAGSSAPLAGSSPPLAGSSPPLAGSAPPLAASAPVAGSAASPDAPYRKTLLGGVTADDVRASLSRLAAAPEDVRGSLSRFAAAPATTAGYRPPPRSAHRGAWLALGGAAIVGMIVAVALVASRARTKTAPQDVVAQDVVAKDVVAKDVVATNVDPVPADVATDVSDAGVPIGAAPTHPPSDTTRAPSDTTQAPRDTTQAPADTRAPSDTTQAPPDAAVAKRRLDKPRANPELAQMLADAEAARRAGNRLRQMALADSALRIDPRNVKAKLLLADALIATGDHDRGCKYLQDLGRHAAAVARAKQAGCVGN